MTQTPYEKKIYYKKLWTLTLPIAIQSLMLALVAVSDALMLGHLNQNQMSAVSLATQVQFIQNMCLSASTASLSILGAQYWGKGDRKTFVDIMHIGIRLTGAVSIAFCLACECIPGILMMIFTNEKELQEIGTGYLKIAGWSYLLTGISQCYLTTMKVSDHTKQVAIISCSTVVLNIIFNAIFIYGLLGAPAMEARGAALSTLIVRIMELTACIILSLQKNYVHPDLRRFFHHDALLWKDFCHCMLPLLGGALVWGIGFTSYTAFMGHCGEDAAAANSVAAVVRDCVCCVCDGIAVGGGILVGNELGAGHLDTGRIYGDRLVKISYIIGGGSTLVMLALTPLVIHLVSLTDGATHYLYGMMFVMAFYMIGRCVNTITINGVFAAGGDTMFDFYSLCAVMWGVAVPLAALGTFVFHWHPVLVYACTCLDEVGKIPWVMHHHSRHKWVKDLTRDHTEE